MCLGMWHFWNQLESFENKVQNDFYRKSMFVGSLEALVLGEILPLYRRKGIFLAASHFPLLALMLCPFSGELCEDNLHTFPLISPSLEQWRNIHTKLYG